MKVKKLPPIYRGEILREEFMKPICLSQNALASALMNRMILCHTTEAYPGEPKDLVFH